MAGQPPSGAFPLRAACFLARLKWRIAASNLSRQPGLQNPKTRPSSSVSESARTGLPDQGHVSFTQSVMSSFCMGISLTGRGLSPVVCAAPHDKSPAPACAERRSHQSCHRRRPMNGRAIALHALGRKWVCSAAPGKRPALRWHGARRRNGKANRRDLRSRSRATAGASPCGTVDFRHKYACRPPRSEDRSGRRAMAEPDQGRAERQAGACREPWPASRYGCVTPDAVGNRRRAEGNAAYS